MSGGEDPRSEDGPQLDEAADGAPAPVDPPSSEASSTFEALDPVDFDDDEDSAVMEVAAIAAAAAADSPDGFATMDLRPPEDDPLDRVPEAPDDADEDHRVTGVLALGATILWRGLVSAIRFFLFGSPPGARRVSRPLRGALRPWTGTLQLSLVLFLAGVGVWGATTDEAVQRAGLATAAVGVLAVCVVLVVAAAIGGTVPSPSRPMPADPEDPLRPADRRTGLVPLAPGVWVAQRPLKFFGLRLGAKMAVMDTGRGLVVYSPIDADPVLVEAVKAVGAVRWIVAPSGLHHLWVADWVEAFPDAEVWAAPGLRERRPDLSFTGVLDTADDAPWDTDVVSIAVVGGSSLLTEVVLGHRPSGTVVCADLVQNLGQDPECMPASQRSWLDLFGMVQRPGPPVDYKLTVNDPASLKRGVDDVATWPMDRLVPAHGPVIDEDATEVWQDAFAFVR